MEKARNPTGKGGFKKGDPRINRKGRPRSFDALRAFAQEIAHEEARTQDGQPITINGKTPTVTEVILRKWASSKDPRLQIMFMEVAYGKVPVINEVTGKDGGPIEHDYRGELLRKLAALTAGSVTGETSSESTGE